MSGQELTAAVSDVRTVAAVYCWHNSDFLPGQQITLPRLIGRKMWPDSKIAEFTETVKHPESANHTWSRMYFPLHRVNDILELFSCSWEEMWENSHNLNEGTRKTSEEGCLPKWLSSSWEPLIPPPAMSVSLCRFVHLTSLIHFQPSGNFRNWMKICLHLPGMAVTGLELQLSSFHKGFCFQIDVQNIIGAVLSLGDAHTVPEISFILQPYGFDLQNSSCVFGCVNVLWPKHNHIVVVNHLCLQFIPILSLLIGLWYVSC